MVGIPKEHNVPEPDSGWDMAKNIGTIGIILLICSFITYSVYTYNIWDTKALTMLPNETITRRMVLREDAPVVTLRTPGEAGLQRFMKNTESLTIIGLRTDIENLYLSDELGDYIQASKFFELPTLDWRGNQTMVSLEDKCAYSVSVIFVLAAKPLIENFWLIYPVVVLLHLYMLFQPDPSDAMLIICLLLTIACMATYTTLGKRFFDQTIILWEVYN